MLSTYDEHADDRYKADRCSKSFIAIPAVVGKMEDCLVSISSWSHHPERDDDDQDSENVQDKDDGLDERQSNGEEDVEENAEDDDGDREEGLMPGQDCVSREIERRKAEYQGGLQPRTKHKLLKSASKLKRDTSVDLPPQRRRYRGIPASLRRSATRPSS